MRQAVGIELSESEQKTLRSWSRSRTAPARLVSRAKIILLASLGQSNTAIAAELAMDRTVVGRWRIRFAEDRLDGIVDVLPYGRFTSNSHHLSLLRPLSWPPP